MRELHRFESCRTHELKQPHRRGDNDSQLHSYGIKRGHNEIDNLMPACARCNRWKSTFTVEQFRREISMQVSRLNSYNNNYRMAKDYGLVSETGHVVVFYFEKK